MTRGRAIGLIPAAGRAVRLGALPCSKEIYPIGYTGSGDARRPKPVAHYLLEALARGGVDRAYVVVRAGKWDIPACLGARAAGVDLAYLTLDESPGVPWTLDHAWPFAADAATVVLGFPDIIFTPVDAYARLLDRQVSVGADVVLGLFPTQQCWKTDMVETDRNGRVLAIVVKPAESILRYTWSIAVWGPAFTRFLHAEVGAANALLAADAIASELFIGTIIQRFIDTGGHVDSVAFPDGSYLDVGTPADLERASRELAEGPLT